MADLLNSTPPGTYGRPSTSPVTEPEYTDHEAMQDMLFILGLFDEQSQRAQKVRRWLLANMH